MNDTTKTVSFVVVAALLALLSLLVWVQTQPRTISEFEKTGEEFFPEFSQSSEINRLEISELGDDGQLQQFVVENQDGIWRIPSHFGYPAEASQRLAETAAGLIGLRREALAGRRENQQQAFGVLDPLANQDALESGVGKRLTLKDTRGDTVFDLIIGDPVPQDDERAQSITDVPGSQTRENWVFVRHPDEKETFKVRWDIDLTTRFTDWIDPDLLQIEAGELKRVTLESQRFEEVQANGYLQYRVFPGQKLELVYDDSQAQWNLSDLDAETETLAQDQVTSIIDGFAELQIVSVRPKFRYRGQQILTGELQLQLPEQPDLRDQILRLLDDDLRSKGYVLTQGQERGQFMLLSRRGQFTAVTSDGVSYTLHFGDVATPEGQAAEDPDNQTDDGAADSDSDSDSENRTPSGNLLGRYVMLRVTFDEAVVGPPPQPPQEPEMPTKPDGYDDWKQQQEENTDQSSPPDEQQVQDGDQGQDQEPDQEPDQEQDPAPPQLPDDIAAENQKQEARFLAYESALQQYESDLNSLPGRQSEYERQLQLRNERIDAGRQKVAELNERFGQWYYIIADSAFQDLNFDRQSITERVVPPLPPRPRIEMPDPQPPQPPQPD